MSDFSTAATKYVQVPLTLEQLAMSLKQLPRQDWEELEDLLDDEFMKTVLQRSKTIHEEFESGQTVSLEDLQKEFHV